MRVCSCIEWRSRRQVKGFAGRKGRVVVNVSVVCTLAVTDQPGPANGGLLDEA